MATLTTRLQLRKPDGVDLVNVLTDLAQNYDKIDNLLPGGEVAYAEKTSPSTATGADVTIVSVTWTAPTGGRRYLVTAKVYMNSTVATDTVIATIYEGATSLQAGVQDGGFKTLQFSRRFQFTAGAHTLDLKFHRNTGTGTFTDNAATTWPSFLLVEDIGPF